MTTPNPDDATYNLEAIAWLSDHGFIAKSTPLQPHEALCITALDALLEMYGLDAHVATLRAFAIVTLQLPPELRRLAYHLIVRTFEDSHLCKTIWTAALGEHFSGNTHPLTDQDFIL